MTPLHHLRNLRATLLLGAAVALFFASAPAQAADGASARDVAARLIADHGLDATAGACLDFVDPAAVSFRKEQWLRVVEALHRERPDYVMAWVVGAVEPPAHVLAEVDRQRECLVERLFADAGDPERPGLVVEWNDDPRTKQEAVDAAKRFRRDRRFRRRTIDWLTRSFYRDARAQSYIWHRKFVFRNRAFNRVSHEAAALCRLQHGHSWNPERRRHRDCWRDELTPDQREREILQASSAPGISRHHWGTEIDLFGLNPVYFGEGGMRADEYAWMLENARSFGFFQPYTERTRDASGAGYMEERWHWSYYPVGQALVEFAATHQGELEAALFAQWDGFEARWNRRRRHAEPYFGWVRANWRAFVFNVDEATLHRDERKRAEAATPAGSVATAE